VDGVPWHSLHDAHLAESAAANSTLDARTAAVALAYRLASDLPDQALDGLTGPYRETESAVPGWDRSLNGFVALAIQRLTAR
jgi:hypothetical protein